ncbi:AMP-dependent synthetase [Knoellia sinensis KCTC 19936]|uniref:AMP-dependent synthetase n=2 Tax=Knoellia TaxID=136099 RepID=A0A0A0J173_9MICO|nr:AMP-dependent synthetase [Knoellia sinensis KCTC 19936]
MSYAVLADRVDARRSALGSAPRLVLLEAGNDVETVVTLLAALDGAHPVIVTSATPAPSPTISDLLDANVRTQAPLLDAWDPDVVAHGAHLEHRTPQHRDSAHDLHPDLALMLSTSGSTGSPKLVRLSAANLDCNAAQIVDALGITADDVAATTLPLQYCYGLSILLSHLSVGAGVLLTDLSVVDTCFWDAFREAGGTTLAGVPYTFDLLDAAGFAGMDLPRLRLVTQAGGRLDPAAVRRWAELGERRGFEFAVMYGQTEATARMATLPTHLAASHPSSIGVAVRGGHFRIDPLDGDAGDLGPGVGELVYEGGNVMMGYAEKPSDLARGAELSELRTGDLARFDADGLVEIVGRRSRFAKVCGLRIDLDRVESDLAEGGRTAYAMDGGDRLLVALTGSVAADLTSVRREISDRYAVPRAGVVVTEVGDVPRTVSGKVDRPALAALVDAFGEPTCVTSDRLSAPSPSVTDRLCAPLGQGSRADGPGRLSQRGTKTEQVRALYADLLDRPDATVDDSFVTLRGDSLSYVEASVRLEGLLGTLPPSWHTRPVRDLARLSSGPEPSTHSTTSRSRLSSRLRSLETSVVLRGVAIAVIVLTHAGVLDIQGGAHVLLAVAGFAFARFQLSDAPRRERISHVLESVTRIAVPSAVFVGVLVLIDDRFSGWNAALLTSIGGDNVHAQWRYWFIEAMVHILVGLALLLCVPALDRLERARPFAVPVGLALLGLVVRFDLVSVGSHHVNGRPGMVLWIFALGWAMARTTVTWQRWLLTAYIVVVVPGFYGDPTRDATIAVGLLVLLWVRSVRVPAFVVPILVPVASASLYIYLVQWEVMGRVGYSLLGAVIALLTGWIAWRGASPIVEPIARWVGARVPRARASAS